MKFEKEPQNSQHLVLSTPARFPHNLVFYNTYILCKYVVLLWSNVKHTYISYVILILLGTV